MATKTDSLPKTDALATTPVNQGVAPAPSFVKADDRRGVEQITKGDMIIPRLALATGTTGAINEGDPKYIAGLQPGDLYNSVKKINYGREVFVQILRKDRLRAMHLRPIDDGGGVIDPNVPLRVTDPKTHRKRVNPLLEWGTTGDKKKDKPQATLFRDYMSRIWCPSNPSAVPGDLIALSFKSSGIAVAKELNGLIAMRGGGPIFAGRYRITTSVNLVPKPHKIYVVENADWVDETDYKKGEQLWASLKDLDVNIDRDIDDEDYDESAVTDDVERGQVDDSDIPF